MARSLRLYQTVGLLIASLLLCPPGYAQEKKLATGFYKRVDFSSYRYIDTVFRDTLYLDPQPVCSATDFKKIAYSMDPTGHPVIEIQLGEEGTAAFAGATRENTGKKIAIIGNGRLLAAPVVQSEIAGGRLNIAGNYTLDEVRALVTRIRKGIPGYPDLSAGEELQENTLQSACTGLDSALVRADTVRLGLLLHEKLSLGHSNGLIETKKELLQHLRNGYLKYNDITEEGYTQIQLVQNVAIVRRHLRVKGVLEGQVFDVKLKVLEVWTQADKRWQLLGRQSVKQL